jgi:hypothetical protein
MANKKPFQSMDGTLGNVALRGMHRKMISFLAHAAFYKNPPEMLNQVFRGTSLENGKCLLRGQIKQDVDAEIARLKARAQALDPNRPQDSSGTTPLPKPKHKHKKHKHRSHPHHGHHDLVELVVDPVVLLERGILGLELDCSGTQELPAPEMAPETTQPK